LKNKNIFLLCIVNFTSNIGNAIYLLTLPWIVLELTNSKVSTAIVATSIYVPTLIFGFFSGIIIDRFSGKRIIMATELLKGVLISIIPLIMFSSQSIILVYLLSFLVSTFGIFLTPTRDSMIPKLINKNQLVNVNSIISISGQLSFLVGPIFAIVFVENINQIYLLYVSAILFLLSSIFSSFIKLKNKFISSNKHSYFDDLIFGFLFFKKNKKLTNIICMTSLNNFFIMGPAIIGIPVFVKEVFKAEFNTLAIFESAMTIGMLFGSFLILTFFKKINLIYLLLFGIFLDGITYSLLFFADMKSTMLSILFIHGIAIPFIVVSRTNLVQKLVPSLYRGRIFSIVNLSVVGTTAISSIFTGLVLEYISVKVLFLFIGFFASSTVIIGFNLKK
jgi:MFS family permease